MFYNDYPKKRIGRGNPYYSCVQCGISEPSINGKIENHAFYCNYRKNKLRDLALANQLNEKTLVDSSTLDLLLEFLDISELDEWADLIRSNMTKL